jgi:hypothetical protein
MPQTTLEPPQPLLLPSRTVVDSSKVKLMPSMTTATPIHEAEADVSQPFPENLEFDLEIDDSYDCVKNERLDIPQEILSKISDQTKTRIDCSTILPLYHFKSNSLANVDQTSIKVVLKYPRLSKYLLFDSKKPGRFFLVQGGRNDQLKVAGTTASFLARACYGIFTVFFFFFLSLFSHNNFINCCCSPSCTLTKRERRGLVKTPANKHSLHFVPFRLPCGQKELLLHCLQYLLPCKQNEVPPQKWHCERILPCLQMQEPRQCGQRVLRFPWMQMLDPPQSLHSFRRFPCWQ